VSGAGAERRARAQGVMADKLQAALVDLDPRLGGWADDFIFGDVWRSEHLEFREQMLVAITALAATGRTRQLKNYLHGALQDGASPEALQDALRMLVVYCGFPTAIEALSTLDRAVGR
jgi:4-carboxymuconolactone decarboxylase